MRALCLNCTPARRGRTGTRAGPGEEEWLTTSERDWTISTGRAAAQNLAAAAKALAAAPIPAPPG